MIFSRKNLIYLSLTAKIYNAVCSYAMCSLITRGNEGARSARKIFDVLKCFCENIETFKTKTRWNNWKLLLRASGQSGTKVVEFHFENVVSAKRVRLRNSEFENTFLNYSNFSGKDPCRDGNCNWRFFSTTRICVRPTPRSCGFC